MRKLLLATSALLGVSGGLAQAGTLTPNAPNPAPGSITVTLNALVEAFFFAGTDTGTKYINPSALNGIPNAGPGQTKVANYGFGTYSRIFPSLDGVLANGLKYGGSFEIRHFSATSSRAQTLFVQREYVYAGADKFGKVLFGSAVQPSETFQSGNPANFNTGGFDGDVNGFFTDGGLPYFIDDDNDVASKIVYVSPQFAGFDFGVSYEPNNVGRTFGGVSDRVSSTLSTDGAFGRRRNTLDGAIRYQGAFGSFGVKANVAGSFGGTVTATDSVVPRVENYQNFSFVGGGVAVTFAGVELDGHIDSGKYGRDFVPLRPGAKGTTAYIFGGSYTFGPVIVGASYYGFDSGSLKSRTNNAGTWHGYGIAAGGTYSLAPGASVYLEYLYGHQKANNYDLITGTAGPTTLHNRSQAQGIGIGTAFKW